MRGIANGLLILVLFTGCNNWSRNVRISIAALTQAQIAAANSFDSYQTAKQIEFRSDADAAKDMAEINELAKEFAEWQKKRDEAIAALNALFASLKIAEATIPLVEQGLRKSTEVDKWIASGFTALGRIKDLLAVLGVPIVDDGVGRKSK